MMRYNSLLGRLIIAITNVMTSQEQAKAITEAIKLEAQTIWGEKWLPRLVSQYCEIEASETGQALNPSQRRSQLVRVFDVGNPTLETLIRLMACVGMTLEASITRKEVKRFTAK